MVGDGWDSWINLAFGDGWNPTQKNGDFGDSLWHWVCHIEDFFEPESMFEKTRHLWNSSSTFKACLWG